MPTLVDQTGRRLGPRARRTREGLLEATEALLAERGVRDLSVVEIARKASTSPATFYLYFKDVGEATLRLADAAADEMPALLAHLDGEWRGAAGLETARTVVRGFVDHWDAHRSVLLLRNLYADEGDRRFTRVRQRALAPVIERLAEKIRENQERGLVASELHPAAAAAAMASVLEKLAAYRKEIGYFGAGREDLIESSALILHQTVTGGAAAEGRGES